MQKEIGQLVREATATGAWRANRKGTRHRLEHVPTGKVVVIGQDAHARGLENARAAIKRVERHAGPQVGTTTPDMEAAVARATIALRELNARHPTNGETKPAKAPPAQEPPGESAPPGAIEPPGEELPAPRPWRLGDPLPDPSIAVPAASAVTLAVERITPAIATAMLKRSHGNRHIVGPRVQEYAQAMREGRWALNGETISVDANGGPLNGHHRLEAVRVAGVPVLLSVARGVDPAAMATFDQHRYRSPSDLLQIAGESYTAALASALRWFIMYEANPDSLRGGTSGGRHNGPLLLETLQRHPGMRDAMRETYRATNTMRMLGSGLATFLRYKTGEAGAEFFRVLETGIGMKGNTPVYHLRELLRDGMATSPRMSNAERYYIAALAWNAHKAGRPMTARGLYWPGRRDAGRLPRID